MKVETHLPLGKVDPGLRAPEARLDLSSVFDEARMLDEMDYDGMVLTETKEDPFMVLTIAAQATERISLTTAVALAFPRSPTVTALSAWTLQRHSGGRFILGLGTQVKGHVQRRYGVAWSPPGPWMREYVQAVRAVWDCWQNGTPLDFHGARYDLTLMVPLFDPGPIAHPRIPVHLAAVNPYMCRVAGEVADGLRPHPICTPAYIRDVMLPAVRTGAEQAGRGAADVDVCVSPLLVTAANEADLAQRIENVRARIAFYASTRTYRAVFEHHGWGDLVPELSLLSRQGRWEDMPGRISDDMLHTIAVVGTYDRIAERVWSRYHDVAGGVEFSIPAATPDERARLRACVHDIRRGFAG